MPRVVRTLVERRGGLGRGEYFVARSERTGLKVLPPGSVPPFEGRSAWFDIEQGPLWRILGRSQQ